MRIGRVISNKMEKTLIVLVETLVRHPIYGRTLKQSKRYQVHDARNECKLGDKVKIMETRPLSKEKRWRVVEIIERAVTED